MTATERTSKSSTAGRPRSAKAAAAAAPKPRARSRTPKPAVVEVEKDSEAFDRWFETPEFESEPDERLEQLAAARRGPIGLAASAYLRVDAEASALRRRRTGSARERMARALDRWAEKEALASARLEAALLPRRWRSS